MSTFPSYIRQTVAYRSGQIPTADEINSYFNLLIEQGDLTTTTVINHLADEVRHITAEERTAWNAKEDKTVVAAINSRLTTLENSWHDIIITGAGINDNLSSAATTYSSNMINNTFVKKTYAGATFLTNSNISSSTSTTELKTSALDAVQNNGSIVGTLRHDIVNNTTTVTELKNAFTSAAIIIPNAGWVDDTTNNCVKLDIPVTGLLASDIVEINLGIASMTTAKDCEFSSALDSYDGKITVYAGSIPTSALSGTMTISKVVS